MCPASLSLERPLRDLRPSRFCFDITEHPYDPPPRMRVHRQEVDDVGPALAVLVRGSTSLRGDRVAVGLVTDPSASEVVPGLRVERHE
jgi:hypothetical protein